MAFHILCLIESKYQVLVKEAVMQEIDIPYFQGNFQKGKFMRIYGVL